MGKNLYYNTTDSPVTIDDEGRSLGGNEFGEYEVTDQINVGISNGFLIDKGAVEEQQEEDTDAVAPEGDDGKAPRAVQKKQSNSNRNK